MKLRCTLNSRIVSALNPDDENESRREIAGLNMSRVCDPTAALHFQQRLHDVFDIVYSESLPLWLHKGD